MKRKTAKLASDTAQTKKMLKDFDKQENSLQKEAPDKDKFKENKSVLKNIELTTLDLIPIKRFIGTGSDGFEYENNMGFFNVFKLGSFDYYSYDDTEVMEHIYLWDKFYRTFANDIKLIAINMPVNMLSNIKFYLHKYSRTNNPLYRKQIAEYVREFRDDLRDREVKDFYLYIYAETYDELMKINARVEAGLCSEGLAFSIDAQQKINMYRKFSNPFNNISTIYGS